MRTVFLALLTANLLFLAWAEWIDRPPEAGGQGASSSLPRLQLVSEAPSGPKPTATDPSPGSTPADPTSVAPTSPDPTSVGPTSALAERTVLRLPDPAKICTSIGPFNDIAGVARVAGLLSNRGFQLQQRAEEGETIEGYWVFVGGMQSDEDVDRVFRQLEKNGFTDAHIMKNYSSTRRVSVGMFSTRERAAKRAVSVKKMGLQPEIGERKFPGTVYWVDVVLSRAPGSKQQALPDYALADIGHAKVETQPCPPGLRPGEPQAPAPGSDEDGPRRTLPRTTVASAPPRH